MSAWTEVRRLAHLRHVECAPSTEDLIAADQLLAAAERLTGVGVRKLDPQDALLDGAAATYSRERQKIYYSNVTEAALAAFHIAHEYAHHWLDIPDIVCKTLEIDPTTPAEPEMSLVGETDSYSPKERAEARANLFAREFLLPRQKLKAHYLKTQTTAADIATLLGVPVDLVMQQLADALFLPTDTAEAKAERKQEPDPDTTQIKAINAAVGPHRVRAAPGTGKTRTLVGRVKKLIADGVDPKSILVLTYSNLAAQDLAQRIHAAVGAAAVSIWTGTFHAFGLEVLRKYSVEAGFKDAPRPLDRSGQLLVLEDLLPTLKLKHYLDLLDPVMPMRLVLTQISRAKDELATPQRFKELAAAMAASSDDDVKSAGEDALEVADIYEAYERELQKKGAVDFGDLIAGPVALLKSNAGVRDDLRARYKHVLVDEYQDMNRASAVFLQELVTPGQGPWVVGDVRQSIYRFRGASPLNLSRFPDDFPGAATTDLGVNYRSGGRIVRAFESFGVRMETGDKTAFDAITPHRGEDTGEIGYAVATTPIAEHEGIARTIKNGVATGTRQFGDHAIIARTHTTLARLAKQLEQAGVPCLYFGDFFERAEIRDLLSLLSVLSENRGVGFFRVAFFSEYAVPMEDVLRVFAWRREKKVPMREALVSLSGDPSLSAPGQVALRRIVDDLGAFEFPMSAHRFLLNYLFGTSRYLQRLLRDDTVAGQQVKFAVYQFLQFAFAFRPAGGAEPKSAFLAHIRRLEILDEEKQLRQLPAAANGINAVRMMTVHASKGLEFPVVHVPCLTARHFPSPNRAGANPPPAGMVTETAVMGREAEEESLFFVAVSRAQDTLHLSRAVNHGGRGWTDVKPSPYLKRIEKHLPTAADCAPTWTDEGVATQPSPAFKVPETRDEWPARAIEIYLECPRQFYYAEILDLGGHDGVAPYPDFHSALHTSIAALRELPSREEQKKAAAAQLNAIWQNSRLRGHKLETIYRNAAEAMIGTATSLLDGESLPNEFAFAVTADVKLTTRADHIGRHSDGIIIRRLKASRLASRETDKARYFVLQAAARERYAGHKVTFEHASLVDGKSRDASANDKKLATEIEALRAAIADIAAGRFQTDPSDRKCPRCSYYFICPAQNSPPAGP